MTVAIPLWTRSIRFRLTLIYSVALFVLGALVVAVIYAGLRESLDDEPVSARVLAQRLNEVEEGVFRVELAELRVEYQSIETLANERALEQLRRYSFAALGGLFAMSLVVGWVVAGRALKPIERITSVARDISATDLSRRINLQGPDDELTRLAGTFDEMLGRLDRAFEGQRRFVQEASHELRNPLAVIRTNLEVAVADPGSTVSDLRQTAEVVDRSAVRMSRVVDDLVAFARSEVPERVLAQVDIVPIVVSIVEEFAGTAEANAVTLEVLGGELRAEVQGDADALRQVAANLIANAIEHAPSGTTVQVQLAADSRNVRLTVADRGPGVDDADLENVFERSWRGDASSHRRPSGSGLGLSIVRQVVVAHSGTVRVEPASPAGGARFVVVLPRPDARPQRRLGRRPSPAS